MAKETGWTEKRKKLCENLWDHTNISFHECCVQRLPLIFPLYAQGRLITAYFINHCGVVAYVVNHCG